jgi:8-oxo-dGTP pyrophosphatase MutT (NUDIX family)
MEHRISAGVLVEDDGRVQMVRHLRPGRYDFWVAPGGGVLGDESLADAARREAREETGIDVEPIRLAYIEELTQPDLRHCKFWFEARVVGQRRCVVAPEAQREHIVESAWLTRAELGDRQVFPTVLGQRFWQDRAAGVTAPAHLGLRRMEFW